MVANLQTVQVPGYDRAIAHEQRIRESGFDDATEIVAGVEVAPLSMRRMLWLEKARNGFFVPCRYDNAAEHVAHALQVLYFCRPQFHAPASPVQSLGAAVVEQLRRQYFISRTLKRIKPETLVREVDEWIDEALMDAPKPSADSVATAGHAAYPAYIVCLFAEGGMTHTVAQIMDMPLKQLWQYVRILQRRLYGTPMTNPSDAVFLDGVERMKGDRN